MTEYRQLALGLNTFAYNLSNFDILQLGITENVSKRSIFNRLYYALYNRLIDELPDLQVSTTGEKHQQIEDRLRRNTHNDVCRKAYNLFRDLKTLRVWADYKPTMQEPNSNLTLLLQKTYEVINYDTIFP